MNKKGFTLVETVVSLAILALMGTLFFGIFTSASATSARLTQQNRQKEALLAEFESAAASGLRSTSSALLREQAVLTLDFGGNIINARGFYLTGVYGEEKLPAKFFYAE